MMGSSCGRVDGCRSAGSIVCVRCWMDAFSSCQRARASCSVLVGRPRSRLVGGGSAGRLDCIQASTSCSHQHRRRLPGSLNGGGIRCRYFSLVAQVLIVVSALPINAEVSSMWRRRGVPLLEAADFLLIFFTILKALGDRVAFAAHDCAARKFSDGGFEGAGWPEEERSRRTGKSVRFVGHARLHRGGRSVGGSGRHARESTERLSQRRYRAHWRSRRLQALASAVPLRCLALRAPPRTSTPSRPCRSTSNSRRSPSLQLGSWREAFWRREHTAQCAWLCITVLSNSQAVKG